ncbi:MAG: TlpA disulfide reductase family protein [Candidatus Pedobacter colombiensis]|uniref:TlpA disulfide reductase family protein n=1 Tax=Candidatus Pedobacter colombiensis TaxID=3121371 RepID=A0AAJ6B5K4_9SPHI|nr:TlpA disulfide reductase family protein [Pedobacter sp.]WEK18857.1 MAG: TlpA disulfide reductase family protein [Pedobacter sp.]
MNLPQSLHNLHRIVLLLFFLTSLSLFSFAQKTIFNPLVGFDGNNPNLKIVKVILSDTATILNFVTTESAGNWIRIPKNTYIQLNGEPNKLFIKATRGIPFNENYTMPDSGKIAYQLIFPKITPAASSIDYGEDDSDGWKIYDIELAKTQKPLPNFLYTEWYNKTNSKLSIAFYNKAVVLDKKVWEYKNITKKNNTYTISIAYNKQNKQVYVERLANNEINITVNKLTERLSSNKANCMQTVSKEVYRLPLLKSDSTVFSGYIKNYSPKLNTKTLMLYIDNNITGKQENAIIKINTNGYFYKKIPLYHFQRVFLRSDISNENDIYLEPSKELFVILGSGPVKYAGDIAQLNYDLSELNSIDQYNYETTKKKMANMQPNDYKAYLQYLQHIENTKLDSVNKLGKISAKAYQVKKLNILFEYATRMMEYHMNYKYAYREAHKLADTAKVTVAKYPAGYYNFIDNEIYNNELNVISDNYNTFINRIKFAPGFRKTSYTHNYKAIIARLKSTGARPSENDIAFEKLISADGISILQDSTSKTVEKKWTADHNEFIKSFVSNFFQNSYYTALDSVLSINKGILIDLMKAQDISRPIVEQLTPLSANELALETKTISNPFIKDYIALKNNETLTQIALNKNRGGYFENETPKVEANKIFDNIMSKYAGKVVLVDFWATWCGPCLNGISEIKPLKEEMKDRNVVFVYITDETSPLATYQNMIPTIKGQHYRLKSDEWRYLADKFKITGIPHQILVNKEGKVVNPYLGFMENKAVKQLLEKYL